MTNIHNEVLYTGVTSDLIKRVSEHKEKKYENSFTANYHLEKLFIMKLFDYRRSDI